MMNDLTSALARMRSAEELVLFLDYDGTLVPFARLPDDAKPDEDLLHLLGDVAARARTHVHVVSGRSRSVLEDWLGALPLGLHAEHGFWSRVTPTASWEEGAPMPAGWKPHVLATLAAAAARAPGALVEEKASCVAWHYRAADPVVGRREAEALQAVLAAELAGGPLEVLDGDMVLEVRLRGMHKGRVVSRVLAALPDATAVAIGDDRTDEDLFGALPESGIAIHVGVKTTVAALRVASPVEVRALLRALCEHEP